MIIDNVKVDELMKLPPQNNKKPLLPKTNKYCQFHRNWTHSSYKCINRARLKHWSKKDSFENTKDMIMMIRNYYISRGIIKKSENGLGCVLRMQG